MWSGSWPTCMPSFILIHPTVWPQYTNVTNRHRPTDRQTGQTDRQRSDSIGEPFDKRSPKNLSLEEMTVHRYRNVQMWRRRRRVERLSVRIFPRLVEKVVIVTVARRPWQQQQRRLERRNHALIKLFHVYISQNTATRISSGLISKSNLKRLTGPQCMKFILTSGYATWFTAGGAIRIARYDVTDDVITRKV